MIIKKIFKVTDTISKKIEIPIPTAPVPISPNIIDDLQDQIDDITDSIENEYYTEYVFDKYDYFISTKPFYFYFEIPLGTVEIASARVSFEVKDYRNTSLTDSRYAITGDSEARPVITFYVSEDKGCKFGNAYGPYETDMRFIDISGDLTGEGIKIVKFTTDNDVCISARIFLKLKVTKIESLGRPEIRTLAATSITSSTATLNGDIIRVGSGNVVNRTTGEITPINTCLKRGFKYATTKTDTNNESETGAFVKGKYNLGIIGLDENSDYYFRAFADNPLKIFGEYLKFTTLEITDVLISCDRSSEYIYVHSGITSTITTSFSSPDGGGRYEKPTGLTCAGNNLINCNYTLNKIYIHSGISPTIADSYDSPCNYPHGLAFDGSNLIEGDRGTTLKIYVHSGVTSTIIDDFANPGNNLTGLTYAENNLISCDLSTHLIYVHSGVTSTITESFASSTYITGLTYANPNLISCDYGTDMIRIHSGITTDMASQFASPATYPSGLAYKE